MGLRENRLLGFRLVRNTFKSGDALGDMKFELQGKDPKTLEPITEIIDSDVGRAFSVGDVIRSRVDTSKKISVKHSGVVDGFISKWLDQDQIAEALSLFGFTAKNTSDDIGNAKVIHATLPVDLSLYSLTAMENVGKNINFIQQITRDVNPNEIPFNEGVENTLQLILNAMEFELNGIHSEKGVAHEFDFDTSKLLALNRIQTFERIVDKCGGPLYLITAKNDLKAEVVKAGSFEDLRVLSEYLKSSIPQLPLPRRHWSL